MDVSPTLLGVNKNESGRITGARTPFHGSEIKKAFLSLKIGEKIGVAPFFIKKNFSDAKSTSTNSTKKGPKKNTRIQNNLSRAFGRP